MEMCPECKTRELTRVVQFEDPLPRFRACSCGYPLEFDKFWRRVNDGPVTDAAVGSLYGLGLQALSSEAALKRLKSNFNYGVDPYAEYETAIIFRLMDQVYIFNFGLPGDCSRYWET